MSQAARSFARRAIGPLLLCLLWAALYLPGLGSYELRGEEGRRILPARAMEQSGDWIVPSSEGRPYHRKPPLINWAIAGSFRLCGGESDFAARLPSALAALALALAGWQTGRSFRGLGGPAAPHFPLLLGVLLLTMVGIIEKGRLAEIESLYVSLSGIALLMWASAWMRGAGPWRLWLSPAVVMGVAMLAKGPVFMVFFYPIVVLTLRRAGALRQLVSPAHLTSLAIIFAVPAPWFLAVRARMADLPEAAGERSQGRVLADQVLGRLMPERFDFGGWLLSPLDSFLLLAAPSVIALIWWRALRRDVLPAQPDRSRALLHGLAWGSMLSGLALSLIPEPHARFQLPLAAPVALLATWLLVLDHAADTGTEAPRRWRWAHGTAVFLLLVLTVAGAALPLTETFASARPFAVWLWAGAPLAWVILIAAARCRGAVRLAMGLAALAVMGVLLLRTVIIPRWNDVEEHREPARAIMAAAGPDAIIAALQPGPQPFLFYLGPRTVECASLSAVPREATHILMPVRRWRDEKTRRSLTARGFMEATLEVRGRVRDGDHEAKTYILTARSPAASRPAER